MRKIYDVSRLISVMIFIFFTSLDNLWAQVAFTKITDTNNPIISEPGFGNYHGSAWIDYDKDGDMDLYTAPGLMFRNDGNGQFTKIAGPGSGFLTTQSQGISWADIDNDGDPDAMITGIGGSGYYRNDNGIFTKIDIPVENGWTIACGDFDNDGFADAISAAPTGFGANHPNTLILNNQNGTFRSLGASVLPQAAAPFTVPSWYDYDQDGDIDLFIGTGPGGTGTPGPDYFYKNMLKETGTPTFVQLTDNFASELRDGQVVNWIDYDNDGDFDFFETNYGVGGSISANHFYENNGDGTFTKIESGEIAIDQDVSLGNIWEDFDNDGDLDCIVNNDAGFGIRYYQNNGNKTFTRLMTLSFSNLMAGGPGSSAADYDNDGDIDFFLGMRQNRLFRNDLPATNHWTRFRLTGLASNRTALGAIIRVKATIGGTSRWQMRQISGQNAFNGHSSYDTHFGLADATTVDSVIVKWPSGITQVLKNLASNQLIAITEDTLQTFPPMVRWMDDQIGYTATPMNLNFMARSNPAPKYFITAGPSGAALDSNTGAFQWTPGPTESGDFQFSIRVKNAAGSLTRSFGVHVNQLAKPTFTKTRDKNIFIQSTYHDTFVASAAANTVYSIVSAPTGMTLNATNGAVQWVPNAAANFDIALRASNLIGSDTLRYKITVNSLPSIHVFQNPVRAKYANVVISSPYPFLSRPTIVNNGQTINTELIAGTDRMYVGSLSFTNAGSQTLQMSVLDSNQLAVTASRQLTVAISKRGEPASIESPDKKIKLAIASPSEDGILLIEEDMEDGAMVYQVQGRASGATVTWSGHEQLFQKQGSSWRSVGQNGRATVESLGQFKFGAVPKAFSLAQNYPNPFNPSTQISFQITRSGKLRLSIYNSVGQKIRDLIHEERPAGSYSVTWDGRNESGNYVSSGIYLYRLESPEGSRSRKMLFLK